ncbi:dolichol kinase [Malassezia yamatoensis]|uniref:dolichol kinase n=1 Tax=Malassezia yamatoensis TaxID=253288 RepID=A0AAJ5YY40_9BASI|nr:dolichol kinase [Malassezia yamatoensis]
MEPSESVAGPEANLLSNGKHAEAVNIEAVQDPPWEPCSVFSPFSESGNDATESVETNNDYRATNARSGRKDRFGFETDSRKKTVTASERRKASMRRQGTTLNAWQARGDLDGFRGDDSELMDSPPVRSRSSRAANTETQLDESKSRIRAFVEAALFFCVSLATVAKMRAKGDESVRTKIFEVGLLVTLGFLCFFVHLNATCTIWATRVKFLRKTDISDALYAMLLMPLLMTVYLVDSVPHHPPLPLASPIIDMKVDTRWRSSLLPLNGVPRSANDSIKARRAMLDSHIIFGLVIGIHILATTWYRRQNKRRGYHLQVENMPGLTVLAYYVAFAFGVTTFIALIKALLYQAGYADWFLSDLTILQTAMDALLFQSSLYVWTRIARQNFTLGELSMACMFNTLFAKEAILLTVYKIAPQADKVISYRTPSALLVYQLALMVGMLMVGLILSPILSLSRVLAQRPTHRLRWPGKRNLHRRLLAISFFVLFVLLVFGVIGPWVWWMLGKRNPYLYIAKFTLEGPYWWFRLALLAYWGLLCNIALLSLQLMVNRVWQYATVGDQVRMQMVNRRGMPSDLRSNTQSAIPSASQRAANTAASRFAAASAEGEETSLGPAIAVNVNGRRKFFHMLAVLLFIPGIAWDVRTFSLTQPAFMHVAFSAAFALFIFGEYLRYCAVYPVGAKLHFFLSQFLDSKDSGLVILSHLYLLSGCAAGVWIESRSAVLQQLGLLVLGIGDSCASLVGWRYGRFHWPQSSKTVEGTAAFLVSVMASVCVLRILRMVESFSMTNLFFISSLLAIVEGVSEQNDNLVLPLTGLLLGSLIPVS